MAKTKRKSSDKKMSDKLDKKFSEEFELNDNKFEGETIYKVNIGEADLEYSKLFGANKNLYRTIPSLIDGLKPGARRLLYSWWEFEGRPQDKNKLKVIKAQRLSANTMAYHPHSDSAIGDLIGRLGQSWNNNIMLLEPQSSVGNIRGDRPAALRYMDVKMSEFTLDCFFDEFDKYCVPMKPNYAGDSYESEFLPAKYPYILFNPSFSGIGYGLASNICSFNVTEVLDATIKLLKDNTAKILLIPDIPTGCDIIDEGQFNTIMKTGRSKLTMRASADIDYQKNLIHIKSLPLNASSSAVISKIIDIKNNKGVFNEIVEIRDSTKEGTVNIDIFLKNDAKPDKVLQELYKKGTGLKATFPIGITVIDDYQEFEYGVKDLLLEWIYYREDLVRSMMTNKYQILLSKQHMNEVLLMVFDKDNIDETVKIARTSSNRKESIERYMKRYKITSIQAAVIADMHVYNFNKDSYERFKEEKKKLKEEIKKVNDILEDEDKLKEFIINQLEEGKKKYGRPRMSKVVKENDKNNDDIKDTEHLVGISESGFIKKLSFPKNNSIGPVGKTNTPITVLQVNNRENVLVVDSNGYVSKISISAIPDMEFSDIGIELNKLFSVKGSVKAVMELPSMDILKVDSDNLSVILITKMGLAKKIKISDLNKITDKKQCMNLNKDDEVAIAMFALNVTSKDIVIYTNKGDGIRLKLDDIKLSGLSAKGLSIMSLKKDEEVVGASLVNPSKKLLFFITSTGKGKVTEIKYFPTMNKKDESLSLISLSANETLVGLATVSKSDIVEVYKKKTDPERIKISDLKVSTRVASGTKIVKTTKGDSVLSYKVFSK